MIMAARVRAGWIEAAARRGRSAERRRTGAAIAETASRVRASRSPMSGPASSRAGNDAPEAMIRFVRAPDGGRGARHQGAACRAAASG